VRDYYETDNIGRCKYSVSFHDGQSTHKDGSPFYDMRIFSNRKAKQAFIRELAAKGYAPRSN
jgi:hypothetical protein